MIKPIPYVWEEAFEEKVCEMQDVVIADSGELVLTSNVVSFGNVCRTVSLTSVNNLAAVQFTIKGTYNSVTKEETITGPNNDSIETVSLFNTITSVTADDDADAITIGSGTTGHTNWFMHNTDVPFSSASVQVIVEDSPNIEYSFNTTLIDVRGLSSFPDAVIAGIVAPNPGSANAYVTKMVDSTNSSFACYTWPARYSCIKISESSGAGALTAIIMQQGLTN